MASNLEIIGLSGKAGSGKDFVGREILRPLGYRQWALAWPMKQELIARDMATYREAHHTKPPAIREALQRIGTEEGWMRWGRQYWTRMATAWLQTIAEHWGETRFYCTDIRFPHEVEWIHSLGGQVARLDAGARAYPLAGTPAADHPSETALDDYHDWDAILHNGPGTTVRGLREQLERARIIPDPSGLVDLDRMIHAGMSL